MRICKCGGIITQWPVKLGDQWECDACGRRETMLDWPRQVLAHRTIRTVMGRLSPGNRDVPASESPAITVFCFLRLD